MEGYVNGIVVGKTLRGDLIIQTDLNEKGKPKTNHDNLVVISVDDFDLPEQIIGVLVEVEGSVYFSDGRNVFLSNEVRIRLPQHDQGNGIHPATTYKSDGTVETPEDRERTKSGL